MNQITSYTPAALYARVSSDRQDVDLSVAAQLRALRDYAQKNGCLVARKYVDEAESGRIADRSQFRTMLDEASKQEATQHALDLVSAMNAPAILHVVTNQFQK